MKNVDIIRAAQPNDSDSQLSYFSHSLLSKIIYSDQQLARPTEQVLRQRWVKRMFLAEIAFVIGVLLLQLFPVIEAPSATPAAVAAPQTTVAVTLPVPQTTMTTTATPGATRIPTSTAMPATASPTLLPSAPGLSSTILPAALPNTGTDSRVRLPLAVGPFLCIGSGLLLWLIVLVPRGRTARLGSSLRSDRCPADKGAGV